MSIQKISSEKNISIIYWWIGRDCENTTNWFEKFDFQTCVPLLQLLVEDDSEDDKLVKDICALINGTLVDNVKFNAENYTSNDELRRYYNLFHFYLDVRSESYIWSNIGDNKHIQLDQIDNSKSCLNHTTNLYSKKWQNPQ